MNIDSIVIYKKNKQTTKKPFDYSTVVNILTLSKIVLDFFNWFC